MLYSLVVNDATLAVQTIRRRISMKRNLALRALATVASSALLAGAFSVGALAPAQAATSSTVTLLSGADITSLNSSTTSGNTAYNALPGSLTSMGFTYYDDKPSLVMNTKFGTMKIVKKTAADFRIEYTVAKGQEWSDGTPIDAVDLLLSHIVASEEYSKTAGLGDPTGDVTPSFDSVGYGATYGKHVVGLPTLSASNMKLTVKFDKPLPDWELLAPGPSPVHALSLLADGKKGLQSASVNAAAKEKFLDAFTSKDTAHLKAMGKVWSDGYNITKVDNSTNDLLLISNGGFIVSKFTLGDSMVLVRNDKYSSGPEMAKTNPIKTVVIKIITDNTASVQALRNGDIDVYYNTTATAADKVVLEGLPNVTTLIKAGGGYSHIRLRTDAMQGKTDKYTGPFAGNSTRARDLRKAFLLATPREQMVDVLIKPIQSTAAPLDTEFEFQGSPAYKALTAASGVKLYSTGTQAERTAQALAIVKKYYPKASATNPQVKLKFVHYNNSTRNNMAKLIIAETRKAGFDVTDVPRDLTFFDDIELAEFDVAMYGLGLNSISQANGVSVFKTDGGNNNNGWSDPALDKILTSIQSDVLTPKQLSARRLVADKIINRNYWTLPLYTNPNISAWNKEIKNIKPAPIGNNITWNYFEWSY
jgi:peptide/nickel transport system substrate-binding protein